MKNWSECTESFGNVSDVPTIKCFEVVFSRILSIIVSLAVLALFIMLVVGGFKYLTSGGDQKKTAGAQATMTHAIMGIALMAIAFLIFKMIQAFTGVDITTFTIPNSNQ